MHRLLHNNLGCSSPLCDDRAARRTLDLISTAVELSQFFLCDKQEDDKLRMLVSTHGPGNWSAIAQVVLVVTSNGAYDMTCVLLQCFDAMWRLHGLHGLWGTRWRHTCMLNRLPFDWCADVGGQSDTQRQELQAQARHCCYSQYVHACNQAFHRGPDANVLQQVMLSNRSCWHMQVVQSAGPLLKEGNLYT